MTKQEAKSLALELWGYLKDNPQCATKLQVPQELLTKLNGCPAHCPLCKVHIGPIDCRGCPLKLKNGKTCTDHDQPYYKWRSAKDEATRVANATKVYNKIKAWKVPKGDKNVASV